MSIRPQKDGGRLLFEATPFGDYSIKIDRSVTEAKIVDDDGQVVGTATVKIKTPPPPGATLRKPEPIPDDYDPNTQKRGCCDPPDPSMRR